MNILKVQNELRSVPDNALIGYVQNPTGYVPTYLALSELQRRKEMRDNYKAAKPEKSTVAQDLEQQATPQPMPQAQPQAGVAGLPVPDQMFSGKGMAQGGIVAFDDGGEVQHYAEGGTSKIGDFFRGLSNPAAMDLDKQIGTLQAEKNKIKMDIFSSYTPEQRAAQQQRLADIDTQISTLSSQRSGKASNTPTSIPGADIMGSEASAATPSQNPLTSLTNPNAPVNLAPNNVPTPVGKPGIAGLAADGTNPYALEKVGSLGSYADDLKNYLGTDPMKAKLQERMDKMDAASAKQADQAPWMALAQAGFSMAAGKSPHALQNLAEGATAGLKDYAAAKDKMAVLEDKRFALLNDMAQADRKEQIAIGTYGATSKQAVEARNATAKLHQAHDKVLERMNNQDNAVKLIGQNAKGALEAKDILKYKTEFRDSHPDYLAWKNKMIADKGKSIVNTPEYKQASEALLNQLVARDASVSTPAAGNAKFLGFE